jgi:hypothetical protein
MRQRKQKLRGKQRERKANTGRGRSRQVHSRPMCHQDRTRNTRAAAETQTSKAQKKGNVNIISKQSIKRYLAKSTEEKEQPAQRLQYASGAWHAERRKAKTGRGRLRQGHSRPKCHQDRTRNTRAAAETQTSKAQKKGNVNIISETLKSDPQVISDPDTSWSAIRIWCTAL